MFLILRKTVSRRAGYLVDGRIERSLFFPIVGTEYIQPCLFLPVAVRILLPHFALYGLKLSRDLATTASYTSMMLMMIVKVMVVVVVVIATNFLFLPDSLRLQRSKSGRIRILFRQFDKGHDYCFRVDQKFAATFQRMMF